MGCCRQVPKRRSSNGIAWRAEGMVLEDSGRIVVSILAKTSQVDEHDVEGYCRRRGDWHGVQGSEREAWRGY